MHIHRSGPKQETIKMQHAVGGRCNVCLLHCVKEHIIYLSVSTRPQGRTGENICQISSENHI